MKTRHQLAWARRIALLFAVVLFGFAPTAPSLAQTPVATMDAKLEAELDRIARETADIRGLPALEQVNDVLLTRDELVALIPQLLAEEIDPAESAAQARGLAALGLIPAETDLYDLSIRLLGEQVAGFYNPRTDEMVVVSDGDLGAAAFYYAHEIVHALQDAHLDHDDLMEDLSGFNSDQELAIVSLYEGDATAAAQRYVAAHPELAVLMLGELRTDFPELEAAPAAASLVLIFPYSAGFEFVDRLLATGSWDAVNAAYADLPASTEQILHPDKYLDRDRPALVPLPDPAEALGPGWSTVVTDTLGELQTSVLLAAPEPGAGVDWLFGTIELPEPARNAAAGWDGDSYALWENSGQEVLVWRSVWDTPSDARAFSRALAKFGNERWGGIFNGESADDIALVTDRIAARILLNGQEVLYVQAPTLQIADAAMAALRGAPAPEPAPGPD